MAPVFPTYDAHDQRQALRLMVHAKSQPREPTPAMIEAHRAALAPLTDLVAKHNDPADYEMLGMCQLVLGDEALAAATFRVGLNIERERNAQSDLCGAFMRRISMLDGWALGRAAPYPQPFSPQGAERWSHRAWPGEPASASGSPPIPAMHQRGKGPGIGPRAICARDRLAHLAVPRNETSPQTVMGGGSR